MNSHNDDEDRRKADIEREDAKSPRERAREEARDVARCAAEDAPRRAFVEAVLRRDVRTWGRLADRLRAAGARYADTYDTVCGIFRDAGKEPPTLAEFDEVMVEADR